MRRLLLILGLIVVVSGLGAAGWLYSAVALPGPMANEASAGETVSVMLPRGSSVHSIAGRLREAGLIRHEKVFVGAAAVTGASADLKAGEYAITPGRSVLEILGILREGQSILHRITIPEGLTSAQIVRLIEDEEILEGEVSTIPEEGSLLPETYLVDRGTTREALLERMQRYQDDLRDEIWDARAPNLPYDTWEEALILASIVEKETGIAGERPQVAAVFVNRMNIGMRLQSDPTIIYGLTQGEPLGRGLRRSEIRKQTPYNTYTIDGLPPTPIANPGAAAIRAVLNPPKTTDFYFVADGTGGHAFARTHDEHLKNVAKWRQIERQRKATQ